MTTANPFVSFRSCKLRRVVGIAMLVVFLAYTPITTSSQSCQSLATQEPIAMVAGQPVFLAQASPPIAGQLQRLRQQEFELENRAAEEIIARRLLALEANKRGITVEKLIQGEVEAAVSEPPAEELEVYFVARRGREAEPSHDDQVALRDSLRKAKAAREHLVERLRAVEQVTIMIRPPRVNVGSDPARTKGNQGAPVKIVEFSDFSCPYCKAVEPTLKEILTKYGGKVNLSYRDFPLMQLHPHAKSAAEAAHCALEQSKFWEYHDQLLSSAAELRIETLMDMARSINMDERVFTSCLNGARYRYDVERDMDEGMRAGIEGTPAFFINGVFLAGAQPLPVFERIIDRELADLNADALQPVKLGMP